MTITMNTHREHPGEAMPSPFRSTAAALEFGLVGLNTGSFAMEVAPFGGIKQSGLGREGAQDGFDEYPETQAFQPRLRSMRQGRHIMPSAAGPAGTKSATPQGNARSCSDPNPILPSMAITRRDVMLDSFAIATTRTDALLADHEPHVSSGLIPAQPLVLERAQGSEVWDVDGHRYLDFVGGTGVVNVGHNHPAGDQVRHASERHPLPGAAGHDRRADGRGAGHSGRGAHRRKRLSAGGKR